LFRLNDQFSFPYKSFEKSFILRLCVKFRDLTRRSLISLFPILLFCRHHQNKFLEIFRAIPLAAVCQNVKTGATKPVRPKRGSTTKKWGQPPTVNCIFCCIFSFIILRLSGIYK
jgi:hypothetical protein